MVDIGWVSIEYEAVIAGYGIWLAGVGQVLVAIFLLLKGSSFGCAVFGVFGFHWMQWGYIYLERHRTTSDIGTFEYNDGLVATYILFGILTSGFWIVSLHKTKCSVAIFTSLVCNLFIQAISKATHDEFARKAAACIGSITALCALYTGGAELINEEYGNHICPGLQPLVQPQSFVISRESLKHRFTYDASTNTLSINLLGLQIKTMQDVQAIREAVEHAVIAAKTPDNKVHVVVQYKGVLIADDVFDSYWQQAAELEQKYFLSARRFHVRCFGTYMGPTLDSLAATQSRHAPIESQSSSADRNV
jgi:hypothetical protein